MEQYRGIKGGGHSLLLFSECPCRRFITTTATPFPEGETFSLHVNATYYAIILAKNFATKFFAMIFTIFAPLLTTTKQL
jgi:hypothetical protein